MSSALKADRLRVVGGLWAVWCVFDAHSPDGKLDGYTLAAMDEEIGWRGFSKAMAAIAWLIQTAEGLEAPDYDEHNGPSAKRRALDTKRKNDEREAERTTTKRGQMSASDADKDRTRGEREREGDNSVGGEGSISTAVTPAGAVCRALKQAGIPPDKLNPSHPGLAALLDAGATVDEFVAAAPKASGKADPFPYILGVVRGQRRDAAGVAADLPKAAVKAWHETPNGIKAKGAELGLPWSEDGWVNGEAMSFPTYSARVKSAAGH